VSGTRPLPAPFASIGWRLADRSEASLCLEISIHSGTKSSMDTAPEAHEYLEAHTGYRSEPHINVTGKVIGSTIAARTP
jgi:hypothetical protein